MAAIAMLLALPLVLPLVLLGVAPASAADVGVLTVRKDVTGHAGEVPTYTPGQTFSYTVRIGCSNLDGAGCTNAQLTDVLPDPIELDPGVPDPVQVLGVTSSTTDTADGNVSVRFTEALDGGDVGIEAGNEATVTIFVRVPPDASTGVVVGYAAGALVTPAPPEPSMSHGAGVRGPRSRCGGRPEGRDGVPARRSPRPGRSARRSGAGGGARRRRDSGNGAAGVRARVVAVGRGTVAPRRVRGLPRRHRGRVGDDTPDGVAFGGPGRDAPWIWLPDSLRAITG